MRFHAIQRTSGLGSLHDPPPLLEAVRRRTALRRRLIDDVRVVAALAGLALLVWLLTGQRLAVALALAAVPVMLGQVVAIATLGVVRRRAVLEAIGAGHEHAPLPEIATVRVELLDADHRARVARRLMMSVVEADLRATMDGTVVAVQRTPQLRTARRLLDHVVVLLLREPCESARGVALCELFLERGALRSGDPDDEMHLEHDLQRISFVLRARS